MDRLTHELRAAPDDDLQHTLIYLLREQVEGRGETGPYSEYLAGRIEPLRQELSRRQRLAQRGAPGLSPARPDFAVRLEEVKRRIDILAVADLINLPVGIPRGQRAAYRCPVHGDGRDRNPSGILYLDKNRWWCFGCNSGGSIIDLLFAFRVTNTAIEALEWLEAHSGIPAPPAFSPAGKRG